MSGEKKKERTIFKFRDIALSFIGFIAAMALSFFVGLKIGMNISEKTVESEMQKTEEFVFGEEMSEPLFQEKTEEETPQEEKIETEIVEKKSEEKILKKEKEKEKPLPKTKEKVVGSITEELFREPSKQIQIQPKQKKERRKWWNDDGIWTVQVGAFRSESSAVELEKRLERKGYPVFKTKFSDGKSVIWRVKAGLFKNQDDARDFAKYIENKEKLSAVIVKK